MTELFNAALASVNIIYTGLLTLIALYWVTVFVGLFDMHSIDVDLDTNLEIEADVDIDVDSDLDVDTHVEIDGGSHFGIGNILGFFNFGSVPFMVVMSVLILSMWAISIMTNHYIENSSIGIAAIIFIPNLLVSLFITKLLTTPLVKFMSKMDKEEKVQIVGSTGTLRSKVEGDKISQLVLSKDGRELLLNVKAAEGTTLETGAKALIVEHDKENNIYIVDHS